MSDIRLNGSLDTNAYTGQSEQFKRIAEQEKQIDQICSIIAIADTTFNANEALEEINKYLSKYDRFLYSRVSSYIFDLYERKDDVQFDAITVHVQQILDICPDSSHDQVLKLYDHVNLAINQLTSLKQSEDDFNTRFGDLFSEKINPIIKDNKESLQKDVKEVEQKVQKVQEESKSILNQLISIVSIFTAVAFIVFGGITSLKSIFNGINEVPVTKLCLLGSIWGLCLSNLIALFMHFIFTLVKADHTVSIRQDSAIKTGNIVLICIFLVSAVAYFLTKYGLLVYRQIGNVQPVTIIVPVLTTIIIGIMIQLLIKSRKNP